MIVLVHTLNLRRNLNLPGRIKVASFTGAIKSKMKIRIKAENSSKSSTVIESRNRQPVGNRRLTLEDGGETGRSNKFHMTISKRDIANW